MNLPISAEDGKGADQKRASRGRGPGNRGCAPCRLGPGRPRALLAGQERYEAARDRAVGSARRRPATRPPGRGWRRIGTPYPSLYSPTPATEAYSRKEERTLPLTFHPGEC